MHQQERTFESGQAPQTEINDTENYLKNQLVKQVKDKKNQKQEYNNKQRQRRQIQHQLSYRQ